MVKFVCPDCNSEISNGRGEVIGKARQHMEDEHDRDVSGDYIMDHLDEE